jgi:thiamine biosynthesis lipoprotein
MGTVASIHVYDPAPTELVDTAVAEVLSELDRLEQIFSTFRATSEISRVNRGELALLDCSPEVIEVMDACTWLEHASDGAFAARRPEPPHPLDPAGFVKGWATERAARALTAAGLVQWYLSVGGDICTSGAPPGRDHWEFGIADPRDASRLVASVDVPAGSAIATSGIGERGRHLWHGRSHTMVAHHASVTVIGPSLTWADAFATATFARGEDGLEWLEQFDGYVGFAVDHAGAVVRRPSMPAGAADTAEDGQSPERVEG